MKMYPVLSSAINFESECLNMEIFAVRSCFSLFDLGGMVVSGYVQVGLGG